MPADDLSRIDVAEVFAVHGASVYKRALYLLGNPADAEEATQEVFIGVMRSKDAFRGQSLISTWLHSLTTHYCLNRLRNQRRRRVLLEQRGAGDGPTAPASAADLVLLRRLLARADQDQAKAVIYVYLDGMSHDEAADILRVSRRTIGNLLLRFEQWAREQTGSTP